MPTWIELKIFPNRIEADVAKSFLESEGITTLIRADDQGGMMPQMAFTEGVKLLVKQEDAEKAQELLDKN